MTQEYSALDPGVYVPLITPFYRGEFDGDSLARLMTFVDPYAAGYVPCLSSGEGQYLRDEQWQRVIAAVRRRTRKPVLVGIKRNSASAVLKLARKAEELGCDAAVVPVAHDNETDALHWFGRLAKHTSLPLMIYNTETLRFRTIAALLRLQEIPTVVGLKDSSMNPRFFAAACRLRREGKLRFAVFQGMEHQMQVPGGCDGHVVALANTEPKLCHAMFQRNSNTLNQLLLEAFWRYNLGGNWYVTLKAILAARGTIRSAEEVQLAIRP